MKEPGKVEIKLVDKNGIEEIITAEAGNLRITYHGFMSLKRKFYKNKQQKVKVQIDIED